MKYDYSQDTANQLLEEEVERTEKLETDLEHTKTDYYESDAEVSRLTAELAQMRAREVCAGCGVKRIDTIIAVIKGAIACCPDCTTLTVDERNQIRAALAKAKA